MKAKTRNDPAGESPGSSQLDLFAGSQQRYRTIENVTSEIERCLKCGLCRAVCPVFAEVLDESGCARGKIALIESLSENDLTLSSTFSDRLSKCLNCKSCMEACPSGIKVDELVLAARAEIFKKGRFPLLKKLVFRHLLRRGRLLPPISKAIAFIERKILRNLPPSSPYRVLLPIVKIDRNRILPVFAERTLMDDYGEILSPPGKPRMRVGYFAGCSANLIYTDIGKAVIETLIGEGIEVVLSHGQGCCGVPVYTAGDRETGSELALKNIKAFEKYKLDAIVTACASCGVGLKKDYETILGFRKNALGAKVYDICEFLVKFSDLRFGIDEGTGRAEGLRPSVTRARQGARGGGPRESVETGPTRQDTVPLRVTYHDPCHLNRGQGISDAPRQILRAIPGVEFIEMEESDRCCGGGGMFSFSHYDIAKEIGKKKVSFIAASGADAVVTGCPSCMMQLEDMLRRNGLPQKVLHITQLLARAIHKPTAAA